MFFVSSGACAPIPHFQDNPRAMRLASEFRKLVGSARNYVFSRHGLFLMGEDPVVQHLVASAGFGAFDIHVQRVGCDGPIVTVLCVPTRIWRDPESRRLLLEVKVQARALRTCCILVPQRWLRAPVRSSVARVLAGTRHTTYTRRQMTDALSHIDELRITSIIEAASAIKDHDDPVGAILSMVCRGIVDIDRSKPIDADTYAAVALLAPLPGTEGEKR